MRRGARYNVYSYVGTNVFVVRWTIAVIYVVVSVYSVLSLVELDSMSVDCRLPPRKVNATTSLEWPHDISIDSHGLFHRAHFLCVKRRM